MAITDMIAELLEKMLEESDGNIEIKRNDLADKLGCVPSQINYVITSRFTPDLGYIIESKRGGGGYIRIVKKQMHRDEFLMHFYYAIGDSLDMNSASAFLVNLTDMDAVTERERCIISAALSAVDKDKTRADIIKQIILTLMK